MLNKNDGNKPAARPANETDTGGAATPANRPALRPLLKLLPFVLAYKGYLVAAAIALLFAAAATLAVPIAVRRLIDNGFTRANAEFVDQYFAMMLLVVLSLAIASSARFYFVIWLGERVIADLRDAVYRHLTGLSLRFFETVHTGEIMSRLNADTTLIKAAFGASASIALRNMVLMIGAIIMMVITSLRLSALVLLAIPVIIIPLVLFGRRVRRLSRVAQDTLADTAAHAQESLSAIQTVQSFVHEGENRKVFSTAVETAFVAARQRALARAVLATFIIFLALGSIVAVLWYGSRDVLAERLSGGELGQFVLYAAFAAGALGALSQVWGEIQSAAGAAERIAELLDEPTDITSPANPKALPEPAKGKIEFNKVNFRYPSRPDLTALDDVSFTVKSGETVAIVGPSGAGKTTVFNLLLRFYDPQAGNIHLDGVDIREAALEDVRGRIAVVPQESVVFSASASDNIGYGRPGASREEIVEAARAALAHDFIAETPEGFDTKFGERGMTLSGGQRQRIAVARALLRDAPVLLLDEATSALDAESERKLQQAFDHAMRGRTTLVIAHRLATVRDADRILVMDEGRIVAEGTHAALVKKGGLYAKLAKLQFAE